MQEYPNIHAAIERGLELRGRYIKLAGSDARFILSLGRDSEEITVEGQNLVEAMFALNVAAGEAAKP